MKRNKRSHEMLKEKYSGLSSAQEVLYMNEFKRADKAAERSEERKNDRENYRM